MDFQTPDYICEYISSFVPDNAGSILEPTAGEGNLVKALTNKGIITAPSDFFGNHLPRIIKYRGGIKRTFYLSYNEAKKWVNDNLKEINNFRKWREITSKLPKFIPKRPDYVYKKNGWTTYGEFLIIKKP